MRRCRLLIGSLPNRVGSALPEGKSAAVAATRNTQTGSPGSKLAFVAAVLLAACHGEPKEAPAVTAAPAASAPAVVKRGPTPEELTAGMVEAVTIGKSTAPVAVKFDLPQRPSVGKRFDVVIAVLPQIAASSAMVQVLGSEGLQLAPNTAPIEIPSLDPTQVYRMSVPVTPTADGVHLLGLSVSLKQDDSTESRSFSVPIIVAPGGGD